MDSDGRRLMMVTVKEVVGSVVKNKTMVDQTIENNIMINLANKIDFVPITGLT